MNVMTQSRLQDIVDLPGLKDCLFQRIAMLKKYVQKDRDRIGCQRSNDQNPADLFQRGERAV